MLELLPPFLTNIFSKSRRIIYALVGGLSFSGIVISIFLFFAGSSFESFRKEWQINILIGTIFFSCLLAVFFCVNYREDQKQKRILKLILHEIGSFCHLAQQKNGKFATQISVRADITNISDSPIRILKARLVKPKTKGEELHSEVILEKEGFRYYSHKHKIPPHETVEASINIIVTDTLISKQKFLEITIGVIDQFDTVHQLKGIIKVI